MDINYDKAFEFAMRFEGYKSDDPDDPGDRTIFGISARSHPAIVKELWDLPKAEARARARDFYRETYWREAGCTYREWPDDIRIFDAAINIGTARAVDMRISSSSSTDFLFRRIEYYVRISKGARIKFLRGWINRVVALWMETE